MNTIPPQRLEIKLPSRVGTVICSKFNTINWISDRLMGSSLALQPVSLHYIWFQSSSWCGTQQKNTIH